MVFKETIIKNDNMKENEINSIRNQNKFKYNKFSNSLKKILKSWEFILFIIFIITIIFNSLFSPYFLDIFK